MLLICILLFVFALPACAAEDAYSEEYELSGAGDLGGALPDDVQNYFSKNGIDPSDYTWVGSLTGENVFGHIWNFVKSGASTPLRAGAVILGIILITAALSSVGSESGAFSPAIYASTIAAAAVIISPIYSSVEAATNTIKGSGTFMLSFIPVFAAIVTVSGGAVTAVSMSALLLATAEGVTAVAAFVILPLMGGYLAMSISASVSPLIEQSGIAEGIRKIALWIMALISTIFVGILSIQTAVNSAADSLTLRTTKFIVGSSIPVAGSALSEAVSTITASMNLLKSSVGIYGVVALAAMFLPIIVELLLWRLVLTATAAAAQLFSLGKISGLLKAVDMMLSLLLGILLLTVAMFIISLTVVITFGKTA